ncbi:MAG: hypothetical protein MUE40_09095 [Anaerolineae bacterium]|nr:hypothetical protein [Anaerolineae bacterium]
MAKKKRNPSGVMIERTFRRRLLRDGHTGLFAAAQAAIWLWWLQTHLQSGAGFHANFFADRVIVLFAWGILLLTHYRAVWLLEERDRQLSARLAEDASPDRDHDREHDHNHDTAALAVARQHLAGPDTDASPPAQAHRPLLRQNNRR